MRTLHLSLVTTNQNRKEKAISVSTAITELLPNVLDSSVSKYEKFENSYKLTFEFELDESNLIEEMIRLSDKICSPWTVTYDAFENEIDLLFNREDTSVFRQVEFNVIRWGHLK